jgi:uncharacterized protein (TIGR04222 family)
MWMLFLLVAWAAAIVSCAYLCGAAIAAAGLSGPALAGGPPEGRAPRGLGLYEAAFLAGGPRRVTDLTLVTMGREGQLLLAHTGWATVVDQRGHDEMERALVRSMGPGGQSPITAIRTAHAAEGAVRALGERLTAEGLAVPAAAREAVTSGIRVVQAAVALILLMPGAATTGGGGAPVVPWFAPPLLLTVGCLIIAQVEVCPYTRWASPAGQRALRGLRVPKPPRQRRGRPAPGHRELLAALAVMGPAALPDPRAARGARRPRVRRPRPGPARSWPRTGPIVGRT